MADQYTDFIFSFIKLHLILLNIKQKNYIHQYRAQGPTLPVVRATETETPRYAIDRDTLTWPCIGYLKLPVLLLNSHFNSTYLKLHEKKKILNPDVCIFSFCSVLFFFSCIFSVLPQKLLNVSLCLG